MMVKDAIEYLSKLDAESDIIIAWWEQSSFADIPMTDDEWQQCSEHAEDVVQDNEGELIRYCINDTLGGLR
jgi:hypothetical protein